MRMALESGVWSDGKHSEVGALEVSVGAALGRWNRESRMGAEVAP